MLTLKSIIGFLCFKRESIKEVATHRSSLWVGLLYVIAAGLAREYDGEYLVAEPWHLVLPLAASLIGCSVMVLLIFIAAWCRGERKAGPVTTFATFLRCYWMTAPMAMVYGIPVERMFDAAGATRANLWLLAIVATWRVLLMIRCVHVLYGNRLMHAVVLVMLFSDALALVALAYVPGPIIMIMGGVRLTPSEQIILQTRLTVQFFGIISFPFWVTAYGVICARTRQADPWRLFRGGAVASHGVERKLLWVAIACIALWIPFLFWTQPEQRRRWQAENMISKSMFNELSVLSQESAPTDFPPHWDPPPRSGYGETEPKAYRVLSELVNQDAADWMTESFAQKTLEQLGRRGWLYSNELTNEDLKGLLSAIKKVDNGRAIGRVILRYKPSEDEEDGDERWATMKAIQDYVGSEMMNDESNVYISDDVSKIRAMHADLLTTETRSQPINGWLDAQARRIHKEHGQGNPAIVPHITCWHPGLVGKKKDAILSADFSLDDARETIAREYGFEDWDAASNVDAVPNAMFEKAVDLLLEGNREALQQLLHDHPDLVHQRSSFGHNATLLHYVGSNGVETWRQVVPLNLAEMTKVILEAGADVNAVAKIYGESTTIGLLTSSAHPEEAGVILEVANVLKANGSE